MNDRRPRSPLPLLLSLLAISILINYIDRGNLAVAAPLLKDELHLSATQVGVLITAFFWTYTVVLAMSSWLVDRFDVNWVLATGFIVWSVATVLTGLVHGFALLLLVRMMLGAGESVAFPCYGKIIAANVPYHHRGIANAVIMTGMSLGPALGTFVCGTAMAYYGWRPVFILIGVASLAWLVPWLRYKPDNTLAKSHATATASTLDIISRRSFWGATLGHFCLNYPFYFVIVWLPLYLVRERHLTMQQMSREAACFYLTFAAVAPIAGSLADRLVRRGLSITVVRKSFMTAGALLASLGVLGAGAADPRLSFASLILLGIGCGFAAPNISLFAQVLAGARVAGKWIGLQYCLANLAGVVVGPLTGFIVDRTGTFNTAFIVCASFPVIGAASYMLIVGRLEQITWRADTTTAKVFAGAA